MDPSIPVKSLDRLLCAEPLERRWLLSGASPPVAAAADASGAAVTVEVLEDLPDDERDGDVEISPDQLPQVIVAALNARFPGATLTAAEMESDDDQTEYGVTAQHDGREMDVTLTPDGAIVEIETFIPADELPPEVLEQLVQLSPGAEIEEAAIVTKDGVESYEVSYTKPNGQDWEAVFRLSAPAPASEETDGGDTDPEPAQEPDAPLTFFAGSTSDVAAGEMLDEAIESDSSESADEIVDARSADAAAAQPVELPGLDRADGTERMADNTFALAALSGSGQLTWGPRAWSAFVAGAGGEVWLPEMTSALADAFPVDVSGVEQGLKELLREVDSLATRVLVDPASGSAAVRLAVMGACIGGIQLALLRWRVSKGGPTVVFRSSASSWSWVLGTSTNERE